MPDRRVVRLLTDLPEPIFTKRDWPDYRNLGLRGDEVEVLADIASAFYLSEEQSDDESALSIHAWRALAAIGGVEILPELMTLSIKCDLIEDEWFADEFPTLLGMLGMSALAPLQETMEEHPEFPCLAEALVTGLPEMAATKGERRQACEVLVTYFGHQDFDRFLRALVVQSLIKLKAVEKIPIIREQFEQNRIDVSCLGDYEEVEMEFGLRAQRETEKPNFVFLESELALRELKDFVGEFPSTGDLDTKLHYFLLRYQNPKSIKRVDELDGYLLSCVLANPDCSALQASFCVWDTFNASQDWQPEFESSAEKASWEDCLTQVVDRVKGGLQRGDYEPYALVWPDAESSMDPDAPFFSPWLEGFMQGELAFFDGENVPISARFEEWVEEVFDKEAEGIRLLEDQTENPIFSIVGDILRRYQQESGSSEFRFVEASGEGWLAPGLHSSGAESSSKAAPVQRNEICPCGSGRKYKKCCMN